jgi:sarcosine oxidase delta subunit
VLVQCHRAAERRRVKFFGKDHVGRPIALGDASHRRLSDPLCTRSSDKHGNQTDQWQR